MKLNFKARKNERVRLFACNSICTIDCNNLDDYPLSFSWNMMNGNLLESLYLNTWNWIGSSNEVSQNVCRLILILCWMAAWQHLREWDFYGKYRHSISFREPKAPEKNCVCAIFSVIFPIFLVFIQRTIFYWIYFHICTFMVIVLCSYVA